MADVTREMILEYVIRKGGVVKNVDLVRHFRKYLQVDDPRLKDRTREIFKERVNSIAFIKAENGEKYLYLKPDYHPPGGLIRPSSGRATDRASVSSVSSGQGQPPHHHHAPPPPPSADSLFNDLLLSPSSSSPVVSPDYNSSSKITGSAALSDSKTGNVEMSRQSDVVLHGYRPLSNPPSAPSSSAAAAATGTERSSGSGSVFSPPPSANSTSSGLGDFGSSLLAEMSSFSLFDSNFGSTTTTTTSSSSSTSGQTAKATDQKQSSSGSGYIGSSYNDPPKKTSNYSAYDSFNASSTAPSKQPSLSSYAAYNSQSTAPASQPAKSTPSYSAYDSQNQARKSSLISENQDRKSSLTSENQARKSSLNNDSLNQTRKSSLTSEPAKRTSTSAYGVYDAYSKDNSSGGAKSSQSSLPRRQAPTVPTSVSSQESAVSTSSPQPRRPAPDVPASAARRLSSGQHSASSLGSQHSTTDVPPYKSTAGGGGSTSSLGAKTPSASNSPSLSSASGKPYALYGQPRRAAPTTPPSSGNSSPSSTGNQARKTSDSSSSLYKSYGSSQKAQTNTAVPPGPSLANALATSAVGVKSGAGFRTGSRASPPRKVAAAAAVEQSDDPFASFFSSSNPTFKQSQKKSMPPKSSSGDDLLSSVLSAGTSSSSHNKSASASLLDSQSSSSVVPLALSSTAVASTCTPPSVAMAPPPSSSLMGGVVTSSKPPPHPSVSYHHQPAAQRHSSPPRRLGPSIELPPSSSSSSSSSYGAAATAGGGPHSPGRRTSAPAEHLPQPTTNGHALPPQYSGPQHYHHRRQGSSEGGAKRGGDEVSHRRQGSSEGPAHYQHRRQGSLEGPPPNHGSSSTSPAIRIESPTRSDSSSSPGGPGDTHRSPGPTYSSLNPADPRPRMQTIAGVGVANGAGSLAGSLGVQLRRDKNAAEGKLRSVATAAARRSRNLDKSGNLDSITRASISMTPPTRRKVLGPPSVAPKPCRDSAAPSGSREDLAMDPGDDDGSITALSEPDGEYYDIDPLEKEWMVAAAMGDMESMHRLLMTDPSLVNRKDFIHGYTALHWAAKKGRVDIIVGMMMNGGSVHIKSGGLTPLHLAAQSGHDNAILLLVREHDASINAREHGGRKPFDLLPAKASEQTKALLSRVNTYGFTARRRVMGVGPLSTFSQPRKRGGGAGGGMERGWSSVPQLVDIRVTDPDRQAKRRLSPRLSVRKTFSFRVKKRDRDHTSPPHREKSGKRKKSEFQDYDV